MSTEKINTINDMIESTNSFFYSIRKTSTKAILIMMDFCLLAAIVASSSVGGSSMAAAVILIAVIGIIINLFTIDEYSKDSTEFDVLCSQFVNVYSNTEELSGIPREIVAEDVKTLSETAERYMNKYKLISTVNSITIALATSLVCIVLAGLHF
jgi:uncharacterized membrane protein